MNTKFINFKTGLILAILFSFLFGGIGIIFAQTENNNIDEALQGLRQNNQSFKDLRSQYEAVKSEETRAKVASLRETAKKKAEEAQRKMEERRKEILLQLIDVQIKQYNKTRERVEKMPNINPALKTELSAKIDEAVQKLTEEKSKVEAAQTKEEIKNLAKEIKELFKTQRQIIKEIVEAIHISRLDKAISKAENRAAAIEAKIQELKTAGKDTAKMETLLSEAKVKLAEAKTKLAGKKLKEANQALKDVYQKLREIIKLAKETGAVKEEWTETE